MNRGCVTFLKSLVAIRDMALYLIAMELVLYREIKAGKPTLGGLYLTNPDGAPRFLCHTLEDPKREVKVWGDTCIPKGRYKITLRDEGKMVTGYKKRFKWHKGMLWIRNIPGFEYVYIHIGNTKKDTHGCILVGAGRNDKTFSIISSVAAYTSIYKMILKELESGNECWITITETGA